MRLPPKATYAILLAFVCLNLLVRYPRTPHGVGVDAFSFAGLSSSILQQGHAAWIVHPLSALGLYPLSYPSGSFFLTAAVASTGGISVELTTLLFSLFVGAFGVLAAFVMAREFWRNDMFAITVALLFPLMPKFVTNTLWEVPARGLLMVLTAIFLWAILRAVKSRTSKNVAIVVLVFLFMSLSHRLAVLMLVVIIAFLVTLTFVVGVKIVKLQFPRVLMSLSFQRKSRVIVVVLYGSILVGLLLGSGVLESYQQGAFFSDDIPLGSMGNLAVSLSRSVGVLSPLALVGIPVILYSRNKAAAEYLFLSIPLALVPTLFLRSYTGFYVTAFFALFIGMGCTYLFLKLRQRLRGLALIALVVLAGFAASQAISFELPRQTFMSESEYSTGLYVRYQVSDTLASNDGLLGSRVASVSENPYLPIGGATTSTYGPDAIAFGFVGTFFVVSVPIQDLTVDSDSFYLPVGVTVGADWSVMMAGSLGARSERIAHRYDVTTILENSRAPATYYTGWGVNYQSALLVDIYENRYKTYEAGSVRLWLAF